MCRIFGAVASEPVSIRHELIDASNPMIRLAENHDSGWGIAAYSELGGDSLICERFATSAHVDGRFEAATKLEGRIFNTHVRRATFGDLSEANTHPFEYGPFTFSHNGTILGAQKLLRPEMSTPAGETDSECFFLRLMHNFDPADPARSLRATVAAVIAGHAFSGLNFAFSDGVKLYAYQLGIFELYWAARPGLGMVASEPLTDETWHRVKQDVLLVFDPERPTEVHSERLVGDQLVEVAQIRKLEPSAELRGTARGQWAKQFALRGEEIVGSMRQ